MKLATARGSGTGTWPGPPPSQGHPGKFGLTEEPCVEAVAHGLFLFIFHPWIILMWHPRSAAARDTGPASSSE